MSVPLSWFAPARPIPKARAERACFADGRPEERTKADAVRALAPLCRAKPERRNRNVWAADRQQGRHVRS